jgi:Zn-finger nucleic acid-binding protein
MLVADFMSPPLAEEPDRAVEAMRCPYCQAAALSLLSPGVWLCGGCRAIGCKRPKLAALLDAPEDHPWLSLEHLPPERTSRACPFCRGTSLHRLSPAPGHDAHLDPCAACGGVWLEHGEVPRLRALIAQDRALRPRTVRPADPPKVEPGDDLSDRADYLSGRFAHDVPLVNALAVPLALGFGLVASAVFGFFVDIFLSMPLHELGHASVAWFSGRYAMPLPFITFSVASEKSFWVGLALSALLMAGLLLGLRERRRYLVGLAGAGFALQVVMTLLVSNSASVRLGTFCGCAGEIIFSTLLIVSFHYRLPDQLRWDFFRYLALLAGALPLVRALLRWRAVLGDLSLLPVGSALGGRQDPDGDMNKLLGWGWSARSIASTYLWLGYACLAIIAAHYAIVLYRTRSKVALALRREAALLQDILRRG